MGFFGELGKKIAGGWTSLKQMGKQVYDSALTIPGIGKMAAALKTSLQPVIDTVDNGVGAVTDYMQGDWESGNTKWLSAVSGAADFLTPAVDPAAAPKGPGGAAGQLPGGTM